MKNVDTWDFNVWDCKEDELFSIAQKMLSPFTSLIAIDKTALDQFIRDVKDHYAQRPYHNFRHVLDVTQFIHKIDKERILTQKLSPLERFTLHLAGLCHDIGHPGRNNDFQKAFHTDLFKEFGAASTLEHFHLSLALKILSKHKLLASLNEKDAQNVRRNLSSFILATDMAEHESILKKIKKGSHSSTDLALLVIKSADLGQLVRPKHVSEIWVKALYQELEEQRDEETSKGISDHLSEKEFLDKQISYQPIFIRKFALPLFQELAKAFPELNLLVEKVEKHLRDCRF